MRMTTLRDIADGFDAMLIDQFGGLLNGQGAYEGAPEALGRLAATGKHILLLSNSGKRSEVNAARLNRLGFARDSYDMVLSSGEAAYLSLRSRLGRDIPEHARVWVHARDDDRSAVAGLPMNEVDRPDDAHLLIIAGSQGDVHDLDWYRGLLAPAAKRAVPALCTNPDMKMLTPVGQCFGAGRIADLYEELGGTVERIGKPFPLIYRVARDRMGDIDPDRVLCIGDSPDHDIKGGQAAGFRTALTRTGLYADLARDALKAVCHQAGALPDFVIPKFEF